MNRFPIYLFSGELAGKHITRLHCRGSVLCSGIVHSPRLYNSVSVPVYLFKIIFLGSSLLVQWLRLYPPNAGGLGIVPGQGTRSHMPQLKDPSCLKKILHVTTQTHSVQPNKYICRYFKCLLFKSSRLWCFHAPSLGNECRCMQNAKPLKAKALAELGSPIRPGQDAWASP